MRPLEQRRARASRARRRRRGPSPASRCRARSDAGTARSAGRRSRRSARARRRRSRRACRASVSPPHVDAPVLPACRCRRSRAGSSTCRCPTGPTSASTSPAAQSSATSSGIGRSCRSCDAQAVSRHGGAASRRRDEVQEGDADGERPTAASSTRRHQAGARHVEALHAVVDRDARWSWFRRECCRRPSARRRTRPACARTSAPTADRRPGHASGSSIRHRLCAARQAAARGGVAQVVGDRLERALQRLDRERQVEDDRRDEQAVEREHQRVTDAASYQRPSGEAAAHRDQQVVAEHRRRQDQRQREQRLDEGLAGEVARRQPARRRQIPAGRGSRPSARRASATAGARCRPSRLTRPAARSRSARAPRAQRAAAGIGRTRAPSRRRALGEHHALPERRVHRLGNQRVSRRAEHARAPAPATGDDAALRGARGRELRGLRDVLAEHQRPRDRVPQRRRSAAPPAPRGRTAHAPGLAMANCARGRRPRAAARSAQARIELQRRALRGRPARCARSRTARRRRRAALPSPARTLRLVGRQEQLERARPRRSGGGSCPDEP